MKISLNCFATLTRHNPPDPGAYPIEPGDTVRAVMERLGVPEDKVRIIFINGVHAKPESPLADGDRLGLFPAVAGG